MKNTITLIALLITSFLFSQNGINYKAVIKDDLGNVIANNSIQIKFKILESNAQINVYEETHTPITDNNGIIIVNIGEGNILSGIFSDINWGEDEHFLNVKINIGSGFVDLGTTQFSAVPYAFHAKKAANVKGLEAIDEGNGMGWRLVGINSDNYGDIGENAIDLSQAEVASSTLGATGSYSSVYGVNTTASGLASTANGIASQATGNLSTAMGSGTVASGDLSIAFGQSSVASGYSSTVIGVENEASGNFSTAIGRGLITSSYFSTAIGRYNELVFNGGNPTEWDEVQPLFEIGKGTDDSNRSNALTVLKDGQHIIRSDGSGLFVLSSNFGLTVSSASSRGASITGNTSGASIRSSIDGNPDLILGANNAILTSNLASYASSDLLLRSNDDIVIELDANNDESGVFRVRNSSTTNIFTVNESGNVNMEGRLQIGTETIEDTGSNQLSFGASLIPDSNNSYRLGNSSSRWIGVWAVDGTINTSDRRDKENITDLSYGLKEIQKLKPVSFNWKKRPEAGVKLGLIAQDLQEVIPEVVMSEEVVYSEDNPTSFEKKPLDRLGVYYSDLIPVLVKAIQEQQDIINLQKAELASQCSEIGILSEEISKIQLGMKQMNQLETNHKNF